MLASSFLHGSTNYVIHRGRIWDADYRDFYPRTYTGANKHLDHQHTSIHQDPKAETSVEKWLFLETEPVWSKNIQQGAEGKEVRYTQAFLLAYGYALELDGVFGPGTDKVVRAFQAKYKLRVDGIVGPKTRKALRTTKGVL
jgi:murein L,D-transpeptidase YcbB/YkuD